MALNFMCPELLPEISCSKPCLDGYDVKNLISNEMNKGFLAESFVKPPVDICIGFACNIEIKKVVIGCKVGSQATSCMQLFTHTDMWNPKNCALLHKKETSLVPDSEVFVPIGKGYDEGVNIFCFENKRFYDRFPFKLWTKLPTKQNSSCSEFRLSSNKIRNVVDVSHLNIRILKTVGYICAVQFIEVWGQPSFSCSKDKIFVKTLTDIFNRQVSPKFQFAFKKEDNNFKKSEKKISLCQEEPGSKHTADIEDVPVDFLDPLTCDLMRLPVLLPSGHTIDQSSLDEFSKSEEGWGRPASDPFTGKPFTLTSKPLPNSALKIRIDHFLLHSQNNSTGVSIVGSTSYVPSAVSKLVPNDVTHLNSNKSSNRKRKESEDNCHKHIKKRMHKQTGQKEESASVTHSRSLQCSLDAALGSLLDKHDTQTRQLGLERNDSSVCAKCKNLDNLYQLCCSHLLCRACLLDIKKTVKVCFVCTEKIIDERIVKFHKNN